MPQSLAPHFVKIVHYPDPILLRTSPPLETIDEEVRERVAEMFHLMYEARGIGLAAPQVGWSTRLFVVNLAAAPGEGEEQVFINPKILGRSGRAVAEEGCLSLPGISGAVPRALRIQMEATDLQGTRSTIEAEEIHARVLQHEFDHLEGLLFVSKVVASQQKQVLNKLRELKAESTA